MSEKKKRDTDLAGSAEALQRAAKRARETAERTRTPLITYKDGHVQKRMVVRETGEKDD